MQPILLFLPHSCPQTHCFFPLSFTPKEQGGNPNRMRERENIPSFFSLFPTVDKIEYLVKIVGREEPLVLWYQERALSKATLENKRRQIDMHLLGWISAPNCRLGLKMPLLKSAGNLVLLIHRLFMFFKSFLQSVLDLFNHNWDHNFHC